MRKFLSILVITLCTSSYAMADWSLVNDESTLSFISTKKSAVSEVHHFKTMSGTLDEKGGLKLSVDLSSVETNIPIRNQRMMELLFEVSQYANATLTSTLDFQKIMNLKEGDTYLETLTFDASLHGIAQKIKTPVKFIKLSNNKLMLMLEKPVVINASQFGLGKGLEKLQAIAKLPSISTAAPVTFSLTFTQ
ncbi:MAG: YceI family protein [Methylococcales bacterium]|nr:YceI family protein [Methylococcales bacterium]